MKDTTREELKSNISKMLQFHAGWKTPLSVDSPEVRDWCNLIDSYVAHKTIEAHAHAMETLLNTLINKDAFSDKFTIKELSQIVRKINLSTSIKDTQGDKDE